MSLQDILGADSGRHRRMRVGRGAGSGKGKTCGRGSKGEGSRSGGTNRGPLFEGGQNPLWMRIPRRGFSNHRHRVAYQALPLQRVLKRVQENSIDLAALEQAGLTHEGERIKIVSPVSVDRAISLTVHRVSASVRKAIEDAGGTVTEIDGQPQSAVGDE